VGFGWTIVALIAVLAIAWRFLGSYMAAVFDGRVRWLAFIERPVYRLLSVDPASEQSWRRYGASLIVFSGMALLVTYLIFRLQGVLPFNPQHLPGVTPALARNTSVSFVTNTNWQAYSGVTTMSYLSHPGERLGLWLPERGQLPEGLCLPDQAQARRRARAVPAERPVGRLPAGAGRRRRLSRQMRSLAAACRR